MSASDESKRTDDTSSPEQPDDDERSRLRRNMALTLAALVVLGGALAILQSDASRAESETARRTTRVAVQAMRANVVADTVAGLEPQLDAERDFLPFRRPLTRGAPTLAEAADLPDELGQTAGDLRVARRALPNLGVGELLTRLQVEAQRLTLEQRALARTRVTWNDRSTQYTTVIAVLAVALFLVGFGLVVQGAIRPSAYALGVAVGLFAAAWGVRIYLLPIPSEPRAAITNAASGAVLTANGSYLRALARYDAALRADDTYATAYSGRSRARLLAANPDYRTTRAVTQPGGRAVAEAVDDAHRAIALGARDVLTYGLVAVTSFYDGKYDETVDAADEGLSINPKVPDLWLLKSAAQTALGDEAAATASLARALAPLRGTAPSKQTRLLASTYLSYLAWVERYVPTHGRAARVLADDVVARETAFTLGRPAQLPARPKRGTVSVRDLRFADGKLSLRLLWRNLPPGTALSALGYERPSARGAWTQPTDLALFATVGGTAGRTITVPLKRVCKPTQVRVDVYLNGERTLVRTGPGGLATC